MGSLRISAALEVHAPLATVWATAIDWPAHSRWVPLTKVWVAEERGGLGTRFVGRTGLGPLGFDDPMTVTQWSPPDEAHGAATCTVTKTGRVVTGTAGFTVRATGPGTCHLEWFEDIDIRPATITRLLAPLLAPLARAGLRQTLRKLAREAQDTHQRLLP